MNLLYLNRNYVNKFAQNYIYCKLQSPVVMSKVYDVYMQTRIDYCSQVYYPGKESLIKTMENAVNSFWKLCSRGEPPEKFMPPGLRLIFTDLVFVHKIVHGNSVIKYEDIYKVKQNVNQNVMGEQSYSREKQIVIPKHCLQISRYRFSFRTRKFWNAVPSEFKNLKLENFKKKLKEHMLSNKNKYLNLSRSFNIVGEVNEKKKKKKRNGQNVSKFRQWLKDKRLSDNSMEKKRAVAKKTKEK